MTELEYVIVRENGLWRLEGQTWGEAGNLGLMAHDILEHHPSHSGSALDEIEAIGALIRFRGTGAHSSHGGVEWWAMLGELCATHPFPIQYPEWDYEPDLMTTRYFDNSVHRTRYRKSACRGWCRKESIDNWGSRYFNDWLMINRRGILYAMQRGADKLDEFRRSVGLSVKITELSSAFKKEICAEHGRYRVVLSGAEVRIIPA